MIFGSYRYFGVLNRMVISVLQNSNLLNHLNLQVLNLFAQIFVFRPISLKFGT